MRRSSHMILKMSEYAGTQIMIMMLFITVLDLSNPISNNLVRVLDCLRHCSVIINWLGY
jgi:hypothetical protein